MKYNLFISTASPPGILIRLTIFFTISNVLFIATFINKSYRAVSSTKYLKYLEVLVKSSTIWVNVLINLSIRQQGQ